MTQFVTQKQQSQVQFRRAFEMAYPIQQIYFKKNKTKFLNPASAICIVSILWRNVNL